MPAPNTAPYSDPTHLGSHRGGGFQNQGSNIRQNLFPNRGRGGPRGGGHFNDNREAYDHQGYRDNRGGYNRDNGYHHNSDGYHGNNPRGRGDYHHRGDRFRDSNRNEEHREDYHHHHRGNGGDYYRGNRRGGGYQQRPRHDSFTYDYDEEEEENNSKDPYAGLMTKKEKDWIIKIQLMQLQTENPYLDDYYYAAWQVKKIAEEQRKKKGIEHQDSTDSEPKLVIPQLAGRLETRAYKPVQFENSLGRLTAASVHNPRHIIDVAVERPSDKDEKAKELKRYKELLLHIENSYNILLEIDDIEKRAVILPEEGRIPLLEERINCINHLHQRLLDETSQAKHFSKVVSVRKGVKLVARIIPLLHLNDSSDVVCALLRHLGVLFKKDWQKEVLPSVYSAMSYVINMANLETLVRFADAARQGSETDNPATTVSYALQNPFGASVVWCLVNRGEHVYANDDPLDMDVAHQNAWRDFVAVVADALCVMPKDQVATPKGSFRQVSRHFERLIDKRTFITIEDKLQQIPHLRAC